MNCPVDGTTLRSEHRRGMDVDLCPECGGMWLDYSELDELEDKEFEADEDKGTLVFSSSRSNRLCPVCGEHLSEFKYRLYDLQLELCPNQHGFWLDASEDLRILELMDWRKDDIKRKNKAEAEWATMMRRYRSPSFFEKVKDLFK